MDEREAIARLRRGDIGGLEALVHHYQEPALKAAVLITRNHVLAEDIVQAAFLRAYERIGQFDADRPFGPWFLRGILNDARNATTRRQHLPLDTATAELAPAAPDADLADRLAAAETQETVWAALGRLAPGQRAAIVAHYYLGLSDAETARRLGVPPGTIRRRLHDARARLRRVLPAWVRQPAGE